ncbi:MAG: PAS domain-containing protein [Treponema sp.]|jgi:PAS domain S-box-containing protein|nr:PAS domain-containing protein [Treponema sp.]
MLKNGRNLLYSALVLALVITIISGCERRIEKKAELAVDEITFRDVPGVTQSEIRAIEELQKKYGSFVYGVNPTTEAFTGQNGEIEGYAATFCEWLSGLFRMNFRPTYYKWGELLNGLETGGIDFTGELMYTVGGRPGYYISSPTINRTIKFYRLKDSVPLDEIIRERNPRYVFLKEAVVAADIDANTPYTIEPIIVDSRIVAHEMLKTGEADAFFGFDTAEGSFDAYGFDDVVGETFFPMIIRSSCLATRKEELLPIISVLDKAMNARTLEYLTELQKAGLQQFLENKMYALLTEEERAFIQKHPVVPVGADFSNYPISFYDNHTGQWQGIFFEALADISKLTGITFEVGNDQNTSLLEIVNRVEKGTLLMLPELFQIEEYEGRFLWSEIPVLSDNYVFISKVDFRNISVNDVFHLKVGLRRHTAFSQLFKTMFPAHKNYVEYDTQEQTWEGLKNDEYDILFAGRRRLLIYTNYYEESGYKLNLVFNYTYNSYFAYTKEAAILKSIVDKALRVIDINNMANQWIYRTFDYRSKMAEAQRPWLIGAIILFILVLSLVTFLLIRSRSAGKELEKLVKARTSALSFETSKLQAMIASIPDQIFCKDREYKYTQSNKAFDDFMGATEEELLGKTNRDGRWFLPDDVDKIQGQEWTTIHENKMVMYEEIVRAPLTGKEGYFETLKAPIIQDGAVVGLIAIKRDISKRKAMENELAIQTSLLKTMITSLPDAVFCKDLDLRYTLCNKFMMDLFRVKEEDIIGKTDVEALGFPFELAAYVNNFDRQIIINCKQLIYEETIPCPDGITRVFETVKVPLMQNDKVIGIMGIGRDITARKEMEKTLAFETSKLKAMIASIPDLMFSKDKNFKYVQCNTSFEQFLGVSEEDIRDLTDNDGDWFSPEEVEKIHRVEQQVINENRIYVLEETVHSPTTGNQGVFETVKAPIRQGDEVVGLVAIIRDITRRKEMEEEVQAASRAKSAFLANMSHELRTPLNVVIGLTDLIMEDEDLGEGVTENLVKISSAGNTLLSIVNDILDFSKIESGKLELVPVEYYTSSLLNDVITIVVTRLGEKPIAFHLDIDDDLPGKLFGDDLRVKQIMTNLLTNAVKYTREGSITLSVHCEQEGGDTVWINIAVTDTGIGIREEDVQKLFSDYNQVDTKANRKIEGTGLGLSITKRLTEMMDGQIHVESEYGKGSTFSLRLRQGYVNDVPTGKELADKLRNFCYADDKRIVTKKLVRVNLNYARVLVVDDMQTNLDVASGLLRKYRMQVDCIDNGPGAIRLIKEGTPVYDAVFMDHMMPGMDGIEAADKIRGLGTEYAKKIPIIALTANAIQGTDQLFYAHDFQAFISKPIDVIEMDSVLRKWVRNEAKEKGVYSSGQTSEAQDSSENKSFIENEPEGENTVIEIPGVNSQLGLSLYAGETDVYIPLLRSYVNNTPGVLEKLRSVTEETLPAYVISVHGLKGTSAGIGVETVRAAALELETKSRMGDIGFVLANNGKLIADAEVIVANVKAWLEKYDSAHDAKPRLKAPDRELLARLREYCENYDMDGIDEVMAELEKADYEEDGDLLNWIREKIDISKMGEVAERLAKYEEERTK